MQTPISNDPRPPEQAAPPKADGHNSLWKTIAICASLLAGIAICMQFIGRKPVNAPFAEAGKEAVAAAASWNEAPATGVSEAATAVEREPETPAAEMSEPKTPPSTGEVQSVAPVQYEEPEAAYSKPYAQEEASAYSAPAIDPLEQLILEGDDRYYADWELEGMSQHELRMLLNGMYALSGKRFHKQEVIDFFSAYDWHVPLYDDDKTVYNFMNDYQRANADKIIKLAEAYGYR